MNIINLTNHKIVFDNIEGEDMVVEPFGVQARVVSDHYKIGSISRIPVFAAEFKGIKGLPHRNSGLIYVVSNIVASAVIEQRMSRPDVFTVWGHIKNGSGKILKVRGLRLVCTELMNSDEVMELFGQLEENGLKVPISVAAKFQDGNFINIKKNA